MRLRRFVQNGLSAHRLAGAFLLLTVFFLPLHLHFFTQTVQINDQCSCYYGGRTQVGLAPPLAALFPVSETSFLVAGRTTAPVEVIVESESARAPPYSL